MWSSWYVSSNEQKHTKIQLTVLHGVTIHQTFRINLPDSNNTLISSISFLNNLPSNSDLNSDPTVTLLCGLPTEGAIKVLNINIDSQAVTVAHELTCPQNESPGPITFIGTELLTRAIRAIRAIRVICS